MRENAKQVKQEDFIRFAYVVDGLKAGKNSVPYHIALKQIETELMNLNVNRGGENMSGFLFEELHAADQNLQWMEKKNGKIIEVINDNGLADFRVIDPDGSVSFQQAKMGYHGNGKYKITKEKYSGQTLVVDKQNKELLEYAKKREIPVQESHISKKRADYYADIMKEEGKVRTKFDMSNTAPITSKLLCMSEELKQIHQTGVDSIKSSKGIIAFSAGMTFGKDMYQFIEGNMQLREVLLDTGVNTAKSVGTAYVSGCIGNVVQNAISHTILPEIGKQVAAMAMKTCIGEFFVSVGPIIVELSAMAGPMFLIGMAVGAGYTMLKIIGEKTRIYRREISNASKVLDQAVDAMRLAYNQVEKEIKEELQFQNHEIQAGFDKMLKASVKNDFNSFSNGLNQVISLFGQSVLFQDMKEFDRFFYDDNAVLFL